MTIIDISQLLYHNTGPSQGNVSVIVESQDKIILSDRKAFAFGK
jgi:hypothetical protein